MRARPAPEAWVLRLRAEARADAEERALAAQREAARAQAYAACAEGRRAGFREFLGCFSAL